MAATAPVEMALAWGASWRDVFHVLAAVTAAVSFLILLAVPAHASEREGRADSVGEALAGLTLIFRDRLFWRVRPGVHRGDGRRALDTGAVGRALAARRGRALLERGRPSPPRADSRPHPRNARDRARRRRIRPGRGGAARGGGHHRVHPGPSHRSADHGGPSPRVLGLGAVRASQQPHHRGLSRDLRPLHGALRGAGR